MAYKLEDFRGAFRLSLAACVAMSAARAFADYSGPTDPLEIDLGGAPVDLVFDGADVSGAQSAVYVAPKEGEGPGDVSILMKSSSFKTGGTVSVGIHTQGDAVFSADASSYVSDGVMISSGGSASVTFRGYMGANYLPEGGNEDYEAQSGIDIMAAATARVENYGSIRTSGRGVSMSAEYGASGPLTLELHNGAERGDGYDRVGEIRTSSTQDGVYLAGVHGQDNRIDVVNEGVIANQYTPIILQRSGPSAAPAAAYFGAAINVDSSINGGSIVNSGTIQSSNEAVRLGGRNVLLDLRLGSSISGQITVAADSNNTLRLNSVYHYISDGGRDGSPGNVLLGSYGDDASLYNTLEISIRKSGGYMDGDVWNDGHGSLNTDGQIDITNARLVLDLEGADIAAGDTFDILHAGQGIVGSFYGLGAEDMRADEYGNTFRTVKFSQGGYEFLLSYRETEDGDRILRDNASLEVLGLVPEPSAWAAALGALAFGLAAFGRRRG